MMFTNFKDRVEAWWRQTYQVNAGNVSVSQSQPDEAVVDIILTLNGYQTLTPISSRFDSEDDFELAIAAIDDAVKRSLGSYYNSALI